MSVMREVAGPDFTAHASDPLAAEALEHWAAKLVNRGDPGDAPLASDLWAAAARMREWRALEARKNVS